MAETTMAPSDLAPAERPMPVGWRFHPTDQELVGHYLRRKLKAGDLSIQDTIPEIGVCKYEPWELLDRAASASAAKFDESRCFFFSPRDYKSSNSTRSNRATLRGFWKVTGRDRKITGKDTNKVIGTKKTLVYHEGRVPRGIKTNWVIHEYHDVRLSHNQRTHVLCWLRKDNKKKIKEKTHQLVVDAEEHYFSNRSSKVQTHSQSTEAIDSMIQISFGSNETTDSMIQTPPKSNKAIDSMIQMSFGSSNEAIDSIIQTTPQSTEAIDSLIRMPFGSSNKAIDSTIQTVPQSDEAIDSMIRMPFGSSNKAIDSMIQTPQSNEAIDSMIQMPFGSIEVIDSMIQTYSQSNEAIDSMIQMPFESKEAIDSMIQTHSQSNEVAIDSMIQIPFGSNEAIGSIIQTPSQLNEVIDNSMIQMSFGSNEVVDSMIQTPHESNSAVALDSMIQPPIKPTIQPNEPSTSMIHILSPEPNSFVETSFDTGEFGFNLFDPGEFDLTSLLQSPSIDEQWLFSLFDSGEFDCTSLLQSRRDERGLFEMMATSDMRCHEA